ncbi:MAG: DNA alkylation repair protein [Leptospirales bacterium]|jgi:3-methyladenine DNA glycosylase AlkD
MPGDKKAQAHRAEVETIVKKAARKLRISKADAETRRRICNTQLEMLGLSLPQLREINQAGFSFYPDRGAAKHAQGAGSGLSAAGEKALLRAWGEVWTESRIFDAKIQALLYYEGRIKELSARIHWPALKAWARDIDNWDHSDRFSKIFAQLLENSPHAVYPTLQKWNRSRNPWLRRQSIVGLLCFNSLRETRPPARDILPLVENLLADSDSYVQKGVGWTLRETGRAYPRETLAFLYKHIRALSPAAFSAATEKISKSEKRKLKDLRK